jgi:hypothetical protein
MGFWFNQPLSTFETLDKLMLLNTKSELLDQHPLKDINALLEVNMTYRIIDSDVLIYEYKNAIYNFLLNNYYNNNQHKIIYSIDTINYFLQNSIVILMYDHTKNIIGLVIGKKTTIKIYDNYFKTINVNFLCIDSSYREQAMNIILIRLLINTAANLNILSAFYTIDHFLPCSSFSYKFYYHRPINILKLQDIDFLPKHDIFNKNLYNTYNYSKTFKQNYTIKKIDYLDNDSVDYLEILNMLNNYSMQNTRIYECTSILDLDKLIRNKAFLKYIVYENETDNDSQIIGVFIFHVTKQRVKETDITDALLYKYAIDLDFIDTDTNRGDFLHFCIETIAEFNEFDMMSIQDSFETSTLKQMKFKKGTGYLKHYAYNLNISCIPSNLNGLVTL